MHLRSLIGTSIFNLKMEENKMRTMKIRNPSEKNICFVTTTYADMFHRKAVTAYNAKTGDKYVNVTVNLPKYSLDDGKGHYNECEIKNIQ